MWDFSGPGTGIGIIGLITSMLFVLVRLATDVSLLIESLLWRFLETSFFFYLGSESLELSESCLVCFLLFLSDSFDSLFFWSFSFFFSSASPFSFPCFPEKCFYNFSLNFLSPLRAASKIVVRPPALTRGSFSIEASWSLRSKYLQKAFKSFSW